MIQAQHYIFFVEGKTLDLIIMSSAHYYYYLDKLLE
jgi:hypothetical protein